MFLEVCCFIWLIDVFYDYKVKFIMLVVVELDEFYIVGIFFNEFYCIVLCIIEM